MTASLTNVVRKPYWSKDICVYVGTDTGLGKALESEHIETLDLIDLFPHDEDVPADDAGRSQLLESRLDAKLQQLKGSLRERCVLIVRNAALLARYRTGLRPLYDWFGGDKNMAILVLAPMANFRLPLHLERDVKGDCNATIEYLTSCLANPKLVFWEKN